jgi:hypothetical protein
MREVGSRRSNNTPGRIARVMAMMIRNAENDCAAGRAANALLLDDLICARKNESRNGKP